jgi:phosphoglycerate kinase
VADATRIEESLPTIKYLLEQKAKIIIISHLGRPGGKVVPELSLKPVVRSLVSLLRFKKKIPLIQSQTLDKTVISHQFVNGVVALENLRFEPGEERNDKGFAQKLAFLADFFVNEAFACSHRKHASIVGIPKFLPSAFGFDFLKEVEVLDKVRKNPKRPVVVILGGVKKDKLAVANLLIKWADWVLIGGKLVEYPQTPSFLDHHKVMGTLIKQRQDITMETVKKFREIISKAKTIVWAGPLGNFYDERYAKGTRLIAEAVVGSGAYTVVGGGDTEVALTKFGLVDKINFISSGGGAMLEFLGKGTLPGIEAIVDDLSHLNNL